MHCGSRSLYPKSVELDREIMTLDSQATNAETLAAEWRRGRVLYPLYAALARECVIDLPACSDLQAGSDNPSEEAQAQARQWFLDVDVRIQVHQLRQFLQTTNLTSDAGLSALLLHHLGKQSHSDTDRDKIDFLLVQYFSHCAPSRLEDADVDLQYVAQVLEPVLGTIEVSLPESLTELDNLIGRANASHSLNELFTSRTLEEGRALKVAAQQDYFAPAAMVAFTRFSFLMRRVFFRLMHQDLNAILDGLRELDHRGIVTLDCRKAQFSANEPIARLRLICQSWKVMFHAEYSSGQPLCILVDLRTAVDAALQQTDEGHVVSQQVNHEGSDTDESSATEDKQESGSEAESKAQAAAAGAEFTVAESVEPEFEVSSPSEWEQEDGGNS
jgi:hypothetical protein